MCIDPQHLGSEGDRASWWKFRGSAYEVISAVHPISRYLNFENRDFLYDDDSDINADEADHSWGNFLFFHKNIIGMHISGTLYEEGFSKMWNKSAHSPISTFSLVPSICGPSKSTSWRRQRGWWQLRKFSGILWRMEVIITFSHGGHIWYPSYITPLNLR